MRNISPSVIVRILTGGHAGEDALSPPLRLPHFHTGQNSISSSVIVGVPAGGYTGADALILPYGYPIFTLGKIARNSDW